MARNRVIYQSEALYVANTGAPTGAQLLRVQDVSHTVDVARQDINEFGKLAAIAREVVEPPTVGTDFTYYLGSGDNERILGLHVNGHSGVGPSGEVILPPPGDDITALSGLMTEDGSKFQKNLFVRTVPEGEDVANNTGRSSTESCIGVGNAFITDYTLNAAVGDMPTVSVSTEASNLNVTVKDTQGTALGAAALAPGGLFTGMPNPGIMIDGSAINRPSYAHGDPHTDQNPTTTATLGEVSLLPGTTGDMAFGCLQPGDLTLELDLLNTNEGDDVVSPAMGGADLSTIHIQNCSFSIPLGRTALTKISSSYPYYRAPDFPINATLSVSAIMTNALAGELSGFLCGESGRAVAASFGLPCLTYGDIHTLTAPQQASWSGTEPVKAFQIKLLNAQLDSQNFSSSIGDNQTVDLTWSSQVGGPTDTTNGVFMKANYTGTN